MIHHIHKLANVASRRLTHRCGFGALFATLAPAQRDLSFRRGSSLAMDRSHVLARWASHSF